MGLYNKERIVTELADELFKSDLALEGGYPQAKKIAELVSKSVRVYMRTYALDVISRVNDVVREKTSNVYPNFNSGKYESLESLIFDTANKVDVELVRKWEQGIAT